MPLTEFIRPFGTEVLSEQRWTARVGLGTSDVRTAMRPSTSGSSQSGAAIGNAHAVGYSQRCVPGRRFMPRG